MNDTELEIDYADFPHAKGHEKDVYDDDGQLRYRKNTVIRWLLDMSPIDMIQIMTTHAAGAFSMKDMMEFYRLIGYSLNGFEEIWHHRDPATATVICENCGECGSEQGLKLCMSCLDNENIELREEKDQAIADGDFKLAAELNNKLLRNRG